MAVDQTIAELNATWWELLQKIAVSLGWSYCALWDTSDVGELRWKEGYFNCNVPGISDANEIPRLFYSLYASCKFPSGVGFAGHASRNFKGNILWVAGNELASLQHPLQMQNWFLSAAGIQTIVCLPLGSMVLELGTVTTVLNNDNHAYDIKRVLIDLLESGLKHFMKDSPKSQLGDGLDGSTVHSSGQRRDVNHPLRMPEDSEMAPVTNELNFLSSPSLGSTASKPMEPESIYEELLQEQGTYAKEMARGVLNIVTPEFVAEFPELPGPSSGGKLFWTQEVVSPLLPMELNPFPSWTPPLPGILPDGLPASSTTLADEIDPIEIEPIHPFVDQSLNALMGPEKHSLIGGVSLRGSSSRSSVRSQNAEDNEISSPILERYECHVPAKETGPRGGGGSSSTEPAESESYWRSGAQQSSEPSSKETSPESSVPPTSGMHPRIPSRFATMTATSQQKPGERSKRQPSSNLMRQAQEDDSTLRLVKFGNVLQLGNASGQVVEDLPQEQDEAAVSHKMAERRRRVKQKENFTHLKTIIPNATKLDKTSLLQATIAYIYTLQDRVADLEQSNQSFRSKLNAEQVQSNFSNGPPMSIVREKGSPTKVSRVGSPKSLSPTEEKIEASPVGDGNLRIEVRSRCSRPDTHIQIFDCLKVLQFKIINANVSINEHRIHASIVVKTKRKNSTAQSAVCAEVEQALRISLS